MTSTPTAGTTGFDARRRPTMKHVAALAGVGIKTVSRVINGEPNVSTSTTARVLEAARALDYHLDVRAGNLRRADGRTRTLGLLVSSVDNPFAGAVHRGVEDVAMSHDTAVFASSLDDDPDREQRAVAAFLGRRVDGLVLTSVARSQGYLAVEAARGTPLVFVDREARDLAADVVASDNPASAAMAARHLISHGHRRVAFLGDRETIGTAVERRDGFLAEMGRSGVATADLPVVLGLHDEASARAAALDLLRADDPPTALFAAQNLVTLGAVRALRELDLHRRVALVGFDDIALGDLLQPGITVVAQDPYEIGRLAAERVFARLDGDDSEPQRVIVPTTLLARGSGEIRPPA